MARAAAGLTEHKSNLPRTSMELVPTYENSAHALVLGRWVDESLRPYEAKIVRILFPEGKCQVLPQSDSAYKLT